MRKMSPLYWDPWTKDKGKALDGMVQRARQRCVKEGEYFNDYLREELEESLARLLRDRNRVTLQMALKNRWICVGQTGFKTPGAAGQREQNLMYLFYYADGRGHYYHAMKRSWHHVDSLDLLLDYGEAITRAANEGVGHFLARERGSKNRERIRRLDPSNKADRRLACMQFDHWLMRKTMSDKQWDDIEKRYPGARPDYANRHKLLPSDRLYAHAPNISIKNQLSTCDLKRFSLVSCLYRLATDCFAQKKYAVDAELVREAGSWEQAHEQRHDSIEEAIRSDFTPPSHMLAPDEALERVEKERALMAYYKTFRPWFEKAWSSKLSARQRTVLEGTLIFKLGARDIVESGVPIAEGTVYSDKSRGLSKLKESLRQRLAPLEKKPEAGGWHQDIEGIPEDVAEAFTAAQMDWWENEWSAVGEELISWLLNDLLQQHNTFDPIWGDPPPEEVFAEELLSRTLSYPHPQMTYPRKND